MECVKCGKDKPLKNMAGASCKACAAPFITPGTQPQGYKVTRRSKRHQW